MGECICYKGSPITQEFRLHKFCTGGEVYVWGFSAWVVMVGLVLEMLWCLVLGIIWLAVTHGSILFSFDGPTSGTVRGILDLSEAMNEDLGRDTGWYTDKELRKKLDRLPPVGYEMQDRNDAVSHLALVSMGDRGRTTRRILRVDPTKSYA